MATYFVSGKVFANGDYQLFDGVMGGFDIDTQNDLDTLRGIMSNKIRIENGYDAITDLVFTSISRLDAPSQINHFHAEVDGREMYIGMPKLVDAISKTPISV